MKKEKARVAVGLSGGVDSSVAAALLSKQGYQVCGITMEIYDGSVNFQGASKHACYGPGEKEDVESAAAVCEKLKIPFQAIDLRQEYKSHVIDYCKEEYLKALYDSSAGRGAYCGASRKRGIVDKDFSW